MRAVRVSGIKTPTTSLRQSLRSTCCLCSKPPVPEFHGVMHVKIDHNEIPNQLLVQRDDMNLKHQMQGKGGGEKHLKATQSNSWKVIGDDNIDQR